MPDSSTFLLFVLAALALLLVPGPAILYIVARSVDQGRRAGLVSTLGISVGTLFHIVAAALGISTLLVTSAAAFTTVKLAGAAYLVFLGIQKLRSRPEQLAHAFQRDANLGRVFRQGVIVNLLNPKTALFFFAFLPQFVDPERGTVTLQVFFLGATYVALALATDGTYALLAALLGHGLRRNRTFLQAQRYVAGGTYVALGIAAAFASVDDETS